MYAAHAVPAVLAVLAAYAALAARDPDSSEGQGRWQPIGERSAERAGTPPNGRGGGVMAGGSWAPQGGGGCPVVVWGRLLSVE